MKRLRIVFMFLLMILATQISAMSSSSDSRDPTFNTFVEADYLPIVADTDTSLIAGNRTQSEGFFTTQEDSLFVDYTKFVSPALMAIVESSAHMGCMLTDDFAEYAFRGTFNSTAYSNWSGLPGSYIA